MVASLYAYNFDERVTEVLQAVRTSFAKQPDMGSQIVVVHPLMGTGYTAASHDLLCGQLRASVRDGHPIIGLISNGRRTADKCRSVRVHMASRSRNVMYEADISTPKGYPVLGEFIQKHHDADFRAFFQGGE